MTVRIVLGLVASFSLLAMAFGDSNAQQSNRPQIQLLSQAELTHPELSEYAVNSFLLILKPDFNNEAAHRHGGDLFGYVLEGSIELVMENKDPVIFKAGEVFHEKHLQLHSAYRNPSRTDTTKVLMFQINKKGEPGFIPEKGN